MGFTVRFAECGRVGNFVHPVVSYLGAAHQQSGFRIVGVFSRGSVRFAVHSSLSDRKLSIPRNPRRSVRYLARFGQYYAVLGVYGRIERTRKTDGSGNEIETGESDNVFYRTNGKSASVGFGAACPKSNKMIEETPKTIAEHIPAVIAVCAVVGNVIQFFISRRDSLQDKRTTAETKAYEQLTSFVNELQEELKTKRDDGREKQTEIKGLETCIHDLKIKVNKARFDILEAWSIVKQIRSYLKANDMYNEHFEKTLNDLEAMLKEIGDSLKFEQ